MKARKRKGFGWDRWSRSKLYELDYISKNLSVTFLFRIISLED